MGADIYITMQGHEIANLGRASSYTDLNGKILNGDQVSDKFDKCMENITTRLQMLAAYSPKSLEELYGIKEEVETILEEFADDVHKIGRQSVLAALLDDDEIRHKIK